MKTSWLTFIAACMANLTFNVQATTHYVDLNCTNPVSPYTNWMTAATNIQDAIDAAANGDLVLVTNGIYQTGGSRFHGTNRVAVTKALTVKSVNGPIVTVIKGYQVPGTIIGTNAVRCVYLTNNAILSGFTLTGGAATAEYNYNYGGGICCASSGATVSNCVVTGNAAATGGGVYGGTLYNCTISSNYLASDGGGAAYSTLCSCVLVGNSSSYVGGGVIGGNLYNCLVANNSALSSGGGAYYANSLVNCTVVNNYCGSEGGGTYEGSLTNCIVYYNFAYAYADALSTIHHCCTTSTGNTTDNFTNAPLFLNLPGGDYHLQPVSPCINSGDNTCATTGTDLDGNPRIVGAGVDVGAYEFQAPIRYVNLGNTTPAMPFANWTTAATNIQDAVDASTNGDLILVTNGVYKTGARPVMGTIMNRVAVTKMITVQSVNGPSVTIIQGDQTGGTTNGDKSVRCVYMTNNAMLSGFTLTNGATRIGSFLPNIETDGGGVYGDVGRPIVSNCVLVANSASVGGGGASTVTLLNCRLMNNRSQYGGGAVSCTLKDCTLDGNSAQFGGGVCFGTVFDSTIVSNSASIYGGGAYSNLVIECVLIGNVATNNQPHYGSGGGAYHCNLFSCNISNNSASYTGGGALDGTMNNCLLTGNSAANGGAIAARDITGMAMALNCTVVGNSASNQGGGIFSFGVVAPSHLSATNCIIFANMAPTGSNYFFGSPEELALNHCCTVPLPTTGVGNITNDPAIVNLVNGNFHLQSNSPCINSGNNAAVTDTNDLDGNPRIVGGTVDIGAYEYQTPVSTISYAWLQQYGLSITTNTDGADPDGDGMNNWQEWMTGTDPTSALSVLEMLSLASTNSPSGVSVTWQSVTNRTYFLQRSGDLSAQPPFSTIRTNIAGQDGTTTYTDTSATNGGPYFYRVGVQ